MKEKSDFLSFYGIYLLIILTKDYFMLLKGIDLWIIALTSIIFMISYWYIIFKKIL